MGLAGQNATEEYDPVHPPGTLEEHLKPEAKLGTIDPDTLPKEEAPKEEKYLENGPPCLDSLLNLDEIENFGSKQISRKAWAYYYSGGDDLVSKRLNNEAYRSILLRPRIFIDCEQCNTETTILGCKVGLPIYVSPAAMARLAHPTGEAGIAKACSRFRALQIISNNASMTPEQITADAQPGQIFAWQIYAQIDRKKSEDMLARINKSLASNSSSLLLMLLSRAKERTMKDRRTSPQVYQLPPQSSPDPPASPAKEEESEDHCSREHPQN